MSTIAFNCPECGYSMKLPATLSGKNGNCPKCKKAVLVVDNSPVDTSWPQIIQPLPTQAQVPTQPVVQQPISPSDPIQPQFLQTSQQSVAPIQQTPTPSQQYPPHQHTPNTPPSVQAPPPPIAASPIGVENASETHDKKSIRGLVYKIIAGVVGVAGIAGVLAIGHYFNEQNNEELSPNTGIIVQQSDDPAPEDALAAMTNRLNGEWIYVSGDKKPITLDFEKGTYRSGDEMEIRCEVLEHAIEKKELTFRNLLDEPVDFDPDPSNERLVSGLIFKVRFSDDLEEVEISQIAISMLNEDDRPLATEYIALIKMDSTTAPEDALAAMTNRLNGEWIYVSGDKKPITLDFEKGTYRSGDEMEIRCEVLEHDIEKKELTFRNLLDEPVDFDPDPSNERLVSGIIFKVHFSDDLEEVEISQVAISILNEDDRPLANEYIALIKMDSTTAPEDAPATSPLAAKEIEREAFEAVLNESFVGETVAFLVETLGKPGLVENGGSNLFYRLDAKDKLTGAGYTHMQFNTDDGSTISTASIGLAPISWPRTDKDSKSNRKKINRELSLKALRMKFIGLTTGEIVSEIGKPTRVLNGGTDLFFTIEWEDELTGAIYRHIQIDINRETNRCDDVNIGVTEF